MNPKTKMTILIEIRVLPTLSQTKSTDMDSGGRVPDPRSGQTFCVDQLTFRVFIDFIDLNTFINLRTLAAPSDPPACLVFAPKKSVFVESHKADITNRSNMFHPSYQNVDSKANILSKISTMKSPTENGH